MYSLFTPVLSYISKQGMCHPYSSLKYCQNGSALVCWLRLISPKKNHINGLPKKHLLLTFLPDTPKILVRKEWHYILIEDTSKDEVLSTQIREFNCTSAFLISCFQLTTFETSCFLFLRDRILPKISLLLKRRIFFKVSHFLYFKSRLEAKLKFAALFLLKMTYLS